MVKMYKFPGMKNVFWYKYMKKKNILQYFINKSKISKINSNI